MEQQSKEGGCSLLCIGGWTVSDGNTARSSSEKFHRIPRM